MLVEQAAKRTETFKAYFEADIRHRQTARRKQFLRSFDAAFGQVLMRRPFECAAEEP